MQTVVMVVDGILRPYGSEGYVDEGVTLYRSLVRESRLHLVSAWWGEEEMGAWLFKRQLKGHIGFQKTLGPSPADRLDALSRISSWNPALVIESDPACAALELRNGYATLLLARPLYADQRWRPDSRKGPQPWDEVVAEQKRQDGIYYADERRKDSE